MLVKSSRGYYEDASWKTASVEFKVNQTTNVKRCCIQLYNTDRQLGPRLLAHTYTLSPLGRFVVDIKQVYNKSAYTANPTDGIESLASSTVDGSIGGPSLTVLFTSVNGVYRGDIFKSPQLRMHKWVT